MFFVTSLIIVISVIVDRRKTDTQHLDIQSRRAANNIYMWRAIACICSVSNRICSVSSAQNIMLGRVGRLLSIEGSEDWRGEERMPIYFPTTLTTRASHGHINSRVQYSTPYCTVYCTVTVLYSMTLHYGANWVFCQYRSKSVNTTLLLL